MHGADDELRKAKVISMVPAAPLLPTSDPLRDEVEHWTGPLEVVDDVDDVEDVVATGREVVEVDPDGWLVVGVDEEPDEHPASTVPSATSRIAAAIGSRGRKCRTGMVPG
jgi:tetrahydromethanopterin S-methyltransferase subunit A